MKKIGTDLVSSKYSSPEHSEPEYPLSEHPLQDAHNRPVHYLRLSVTDRCNLKCLYCHVDKTYIPHNKIMSYEEMQYLVNIFMQMGVRKVRLTGGEPFLRKDFMSFLEGLRKEHSDLDIRITTNGTLLKPYIRTLKDLNVYVNLSLDTLDGDKFRQITGSDKLDIVRESLDLLMESQVPVKLNVVALRGFNDNELDGFLDLVERYPIDLRFIEFMPMGQNTSWTQNSVWSTKVIYEKIQERFTLKPITKQGKEDGPAVIYELLEATGRVLKGRVGLISPISRHYCKTCNRLRVTSDGNMRLCLYDDKEYSLLSIIRSKDPDIIQNRDTYLKNYIVKALQQKPIGSEMLGNGSVSVRSMHSIGG